MPPPLPLEFPRMRSHSEIAFWISVAQLRSQSPTPPVSRRSGLRLKRIAKWCEESKVTAVGIKLRTDTYNDLLVSLAVCCRCCLIMT
jgi:hypothetical protein